MYHTINIVFLKQYALSIESGASWLIVGCELSWVRGASWPERVAWVRVDLLPQWARPYSSRSELEPDRYACNLVVGVKTNTSLDWRGLVYVD